MPRYDGVRGRSSRRAASSFPRAIRRPAGRRDRGGLGNLKNELVLKMIREQGVEAYEGSVEYVHAARDAGLARAVVSSSANCKDVLVAAGIDDLFDEVVDGIVAQEQSLKGKPAPDTFVYAARAFGLEPAQAAVFEDALAGVAAGRAREVRLRRRRRPRRSARGARASTARTSSSTTSPSCCGR